MPLLDSELNESVEALFRVLSKTRVGMLGPVGDSAHLQPMTHFVDRAANRIWFITSAQTQLARGLLSGRPQNITYCVVNSNSTYFASLTGQLILSNDRDKLASLWSPMVDAWFDGGKDDPDVVLLEMVLKEGSVWITTSNTFLLGFEIMRSLVDTEHTPDVGKHELLTFAVAD